MPHVAKLDQDKDYLEPVEDALKNCGAAFFNGRDSLSLWPNISGIGRT